MAFYKKGHKVDFYNLHRPYCLVHVRGRDIWVNVNSYFFHLMP